MDANSSPISLSLFLYHSGTKQLEQKRCYEVCCDFQKGIKRAPLLSQRFLFFWAPLLVSLVTRGRAHAECTTGSPKTFTALWRSLTASCNHLTVSVKDSQVHSIFDEILSVVFGVHVKWLYSKSAKHPRCQNNSRLIDYVGSCPRFFWCDVTGSKSASFTCMHALLFNYKGCVGFLAQFAHMHVNSQHFIWPSYTRGVVQCISLLFLTHRCNVWPAQHAGRAEHIPVTWQRPTSDGRTRLENAALKSTCRLHRTDQPTCMYTDRKAKQRHNTLNKPK